MLRRNFKKALRESTYYKTIASFNKEKIKPGKTYISLSAKKVIHFNLPLAKCNYNFFLLSVNFLSQ